jgi:hypothetical protein
VATIGSYYWVCYITDATLWDRVADTTSGTAYFKNIAGSYTTPPTSLANDYTSGTATYRMYLTIGP